MNYEPLTYQHRFASGLVANVVVQRQEDTKPRIVSDFKAQEATTEEISEYSQWRQQIVADMMCRLTPGEVLGCAAKGISALRRAKS